MHFTILPCFTLDPYYFQVDDLVCPPKIREVRGSEYTHFEADQNVLAPILYCKMIQMNEDFIEAPFKKDKIYFKTLFKKGVFEGVLRSTVIMEDNKVMRWGRIQDLRESVTVSIF